MPLWFIITMIIANLLSFGLFFAIQKNIHHVTSGYIKIVGADNEKLMRTHSLWIIKIMYLLAIIILPILFFIFSQ